MKTSVTMIRKMGNFEVFQRTKDGMFNATTLLNQWNESSGQKKVISHYFENKSTEEFVESLLEDDDFKHRNSVYLKTRGKYGGTWMHPYLFIDFAMWMNPKFKVKVIKFVYDELIKQRHLAGDNYVILSSSGSKLQGYNYSKVATALQYIVFGTKGKGLRQTATQEQLEELATIQNQLAFSIDMGFIKTFKALINKLRIMYNNKYQVKDLKLA